MDGDTGEDLAQAAAASMHARDRASRELGIEVDEIRPGFARMRMTVREWMLQGHEVCHGGLLFTLADTAMAFAANSHNEQHLAVNASIDYVRPARAGDTLVAIATEANRTRRTGLYDVRVVDGEGRPVCLFRGRTMSVGGAVLRDD